MLHKVYTTWFELRRPADEAFIYYDVTDDYRNENNKIAISLFKTF